MPINKGYKTFLVMFNGVVTPAVVLNTTETKNHKGKRSAIFNEFRTTVKWFLISFYNGITINNLCGINIIPHKKLLTLLCSAREAKRLKIK